MSSNANVEGVTIQVAPGELIDKITILQIKTERIQDANKLRNVRVELGSLNQAKEAQLACDRHLSDFQGQLKAVNEQLWDIEDEIRLCERDKEFGPQFVELARSVYVQNDRRAALKRQINELLGSRFIEEKDYQDYS